MSQRLVSLRRITSARRAEHGELAALEPTALQQLDRLLELVVIVEHADDLDLVRLAYREGSRSVPPVSLAPVSLAPASLTEV
jgi:hypothetical protein